MGGAIKKETSHQHGGDAGWRTQLWQEYLDESARDQGYG
jgi:hypothetical protein